MICNLKALSLALVAAFAMSAVVASVASADLFEADETPTVWTGVQTGNQVWNVWGFETSCTGATFTGTVLGKTAEEVTLHPKYTGCTSSLGASTVDTTGCNFVLGTATDANGDAPMRIECEGTNKIKETAPLGCTISVGAQTPKGGVSYTNEKPGGTPTEAVIVTFTVTGIAYTTTFACQLAGLTASDADGVYTGSVTVSGFEDGGIVGGSTAEGFSFSDPNRVGIRVKSP